MSTPVTIEVTGPDTADVVEVAQQGPPGPTGAAGPNQVTDATVLGTLTEAVNPSALLVADAAAPGFVRELTASALGFSVLAAADATAARGLLSAEAAGTAAALLAAHVAAADPHGDRAYASGLVSALAGTLGTLATLNAAPAGTLTGATLAANVLASSLTSVGTLTGGATGAGFTIALDSSTITGTLADARLSANIPRLNAANAFSVGGQSIQTAAGTVGLTVQGAASQTALLFRSLTSGSVTYTGNSPFLGSGTGSVYFGARNTSLGVDTLTTGQQNVWIGDQCQTQGTTTATSNSVAVGYQAKAGTQSVAIGSGTAAGESTPSACVAIGRNAGATGIRSYCIGDGPQNTATRSFLISVNSGAGKDPDHATGLFTWNTESTDPGIALGRWTSTGSTDGNRVIASIRTTWADNTHASRLGRLTLSAYNITSPLEGLRIEGNSAGVRVSLFGQTAVARSTGWAVTNPSTRKTFDTTTVTLPQLAEVVGTLVDYLKTLGPLGA